MIKKILNWIIKKSFFMFDDTLSVATPAGTDDPTQGDDRIRELKRAIIERLAVEHTIPASGSTYDGTTVGYHKLIRLPEQAAAPTTPASYGAIYTKDSGTQTEAYFREESNGDEVQLTKDGEVNALTATNYATSILTPKEYTDLSDTSSSNENTTNAAYQDTTLTKTFTPSKEGLVIANFSGLATMSSGAGFVALLVDDVAVDEAYVNGGGPASDNIKLSYNAVLTAAEHTIKVQIKADGGGGATSLRGDLVTTRLNISHPT